MIVNSFSEGTSISWRICGDDAQAEPLLSIYESELPNVLITALAEYQKLLLQEGLLVKYTGTALPSMITEEDQIL